MTAPESQDGAPRVTEPDRSFAERLKEEAPAWVRDGLVTREQAERVLARYGERGALLPAGRARGGGTAAAWFTGILYGTVAVLIGAASLVVLFVGLDVGESALPFIAAGGVLLAAGAALHATPVRSGFADAVLTAALLPLAVAVWPAEASWAAVPALVAAVALLALRRGEDFVSVLAVVAFTASALGFSVTWLFIDAGAAWLPLQLALLIGLVLRDRFVTKTDGDVEAAVATFAIAFAVGILLASSFSLTTEAAELGAGAGAAVIAGAGLLLRHRGVVVGGGAAIGVVAIMFSFDVGGALLGTLVLLGLAGVLVWQAETLRGWLARA